MKAFQKKENTGLVEGSRTVNVMDAPFIVDFPDYIERIRRNLIVFGFISTVLVLSGMELKAEGSILGLSYKGLDPMVLYVCLCIATAYHLIHFTLAAWSYVMKWRLQLSGFKQRITEGSFTENKEYSIEEVTLYTWWVKHSEVFQKHREWFAEAKTTIENDHEEIIAFCKQDPNENRFSNIEGKLFNIEGRLGHLSTPGSATDAPPEFNEGDLDERLKRFDNWFWGFQKVDAARWFLTELGVPFLIGVTGTVCLLVEILK
jgi:hypothetical protein